MRKASSSTRRYFIINWSRVFLNVSLLTLAKGTKEHLVEKEQALLVARQRFLEAQDELEELRTMIRDQAGQLDDYRNKYLQVWLTSRILKCLFILKTIGI